MHQSSLNDLGVAADVIVAARQDAHDRLPRLDVEPRQRRCRQGSCRLSDDAVVLIEGEHLDTDGPLLDAGDLTLSPRDDRIGRITRLLGRRTIGEGIDLRQHNWMASVQSGSQGCGSGRLNPNQPGLRQPVPQGDDAASQQPATTHWYDDHVRHPPQLLEHLKHQGALTCDHPGVIEGRHEGSSRLGGLLGSSCSGCVVGVALDHQGDMPLAQSQHPITLLPGSV